MKSHINVVALSICAASLLLFVFTMVLYAVKIKKIKKALKDAGKNQMPKARGSYWGVLFSAVVLILLPLLVPMKTYFIAVVCCCAIMHGNDFPFEIAFTDTILF